MHDDDVMDRLLSDAMASDVPRLSAAFEANVMRRLQPRRLTPTGRLVLAVYAVVAVATSVWLMRDLPVEWIAAAVAVSVPVAAVTRLYGRRLARGE